VCVEQKLFDDDDDYAQHTASNFPEMTSFERACCGDKTRAREITRKPKQFVDIGKQAS